MAFNVNEFKGSLSSGIAKTSHFEVMFTPPSGIGIDFDISRQLTYRADSVEIPGRTALTIEHRFAENGPLSKIPYTQVFGDVTITFILSDGLGEKLFFESWMASMMDTTPQGAGQSFNVKYFENYKSDLDIRQFDSNGKLRNTIKLIDSYPIIMNGIQMGWNDDSIAKLSLQFALRYYEIIPSEDQVAESKEVVTQPNNAARAPISIGIDQREGSTPSPSNRVFTGLASGQ
jgi:hypothetical protein